MKLYIHINPPANFVFHSILQTKITTFYGGTKPRPDLET